MAGKPPDGGCHGGTISPFAHTATPKLHNTAQARPERITQGQQASRPEGPQSPHRHAGSDKTAWRHQDTRQTGRQIKKPYMPPHTHCFPSAATPAMPGGNHKGAKAQASRSQRKAHSHTRHHGPQRGHRRCRLKHQGTGHSLDHANRNKHYAHTNSNLTNKQKTTNSK